MVEWVIFKYIYFISYSFINGQVLFKIGRCSIVYSLIFN